MAADVSMPSVVLFLEGTSTLDVFQKLVSSLQRGGRRVHVFAKGGAADRPPPRAAEPRERTGGVERALDNPSESVGSLR